MNATGSEGRENGCRIRSVSVGLPAADEAATGDYVVTMDADGFHPAERIIDLLDHGDDAEAVICSHYVASASAQMSWDQAILSRLLNALIARSLAVPVRDMSSRFRIHQRRVLGDLNLASEKYDVLQEIPVQLFTLGHHVAEIPFAILCPGSAERRTRDPWRSRRTSSRRSGAFSRCAITSGPRTTTRGLTTVFGPEACS